MKKINIIALVFALFILNPVFGRTEEASPRSKWALGFSGLGNKWGSGRPSIRYSRNEKVSWDFTPTLSLSDSFSPARKSVTLPKSQAYGLEFGRTQTLRSRGGLDFGYRFDLGYTYYYSRSDYSGSSYSYKFTSKAYSASVGLGVSVEYFPKKVSWLSIGGVAGLNLSFRESVDRYIYSGVLPDGTFVSNSMQLNIFGNIFNAHIYF